MKPSMSDPSPIPSDLLDRIAKEEYCYLTTTGRVSGKPHEIEIFVQLRKFDGSADTPKSVRFAWPA